MSADIDKERADFEAAMNAARSFPAELSFARTKSPSGRDEYANSHLQSCWVGWQARASIPQAPAEHQKRAKDQNAHDIGMAHIICDGAGIPPGQIIARLVALSGKGDAVRQSLQPPCHCQPGKCEAPRPNWCRDAAKRDATPTAEPTSRPENETKGSSNAK